MCGRCLVGWSQLSFVDAADRCTHFLGIQLSVRRAQPLCSFVLTVMLAEMR